VLRSCSSALVEDDIAVEHDDQSPRRLCPGKDEAAGLGVAVVIDRPRAAAHTCAFL
jgi:hypothetical protein